LEKPPINLKFRVPRFTNGNAILTNIESKCLCQNLFSDKNPEIEKLKKENHELKMLVAEKELIIRVQNELLKKSPWQKNPTISSPELYQRLTSKHLHNVTILDRLNN
jgi:hypothetical protein